jgi:hypothetical protein
MIKSHSPVSADAEDHYAFSGFAWVQCFDFNLTSNILPSFTYFFPPFIEPELLHMVCRIFNLI